MSIFITGNAQNLSYEPCGTPSYRSDWLKRYQANPTSYRNGVDTVLYIPLTIHIVGKDDGTGYHPTKPIFDAFCTLNEDFKDANIQFYIEGDFRYIDSASYYNHGTVIKGYEMMITNNVPNTINCYVVNNPANTGGYNLPSANAICLRKSGTNSGSHTWAHEIGHNLSIQHPFLGWEGDTYNYNTATPTTVTYDYTLFKPILYTDTTIIDTAFVELMDGSNCTFAADGFCDTPPDYLSFGWQCNGNFESQQLQKDPNNIDFRSDGTNIMSYSFDACQSRFTNDQIMAMRANIYSTKSSYLYNQNPTKDTITQLPTLTSPVAGATEPVNQVSLNWSSVTGATKYLVEVSLFASFSILQGEYLVSGTSFQIPAGDLLENRTYNWRVKPFNEGYTCAGYTSKETFFTGSPVNTISITKEATWSIFPNPINAQQPLLINYTGSKNQQGSISLYAMNGQKIHQRIFNTTDNQSITISPSHFKTDGIYIVVIDTGEMILQEKVMVIK